MTKANSEETKAPACPFAAQWVEAAKLVFLANPGWKRIYDEAPSGAKRRLEISFWFTENLSGRKDCPDMLAAYREWREDVERAMTEEDIIYMFKTMDKPAAKEHYKSLLKGLRTHSHVGKSGVALMSYDDFFAMLDEQGEFQSPAYDDETKESIIAEFLPVLKGSGDPLETHVEDILATAELKEVRVYPKGELMYVRVMVRFLTETAEWSDLYQMLAAWDCIHDLKGYVFPVGKGHRSELPIELENPENKAQHEKRMQLMAIRVAATTKQKGVK